MSRVAIALATYKPDLELLRKQLASLDAQTYADWFLVVHDDASMDLAELRAVVGLRRAVVVQASVRAGAVANFGAALACVPEDCSLIAFCDQDDEWEPGKLARLVAEFADEHVMAVHSDLSLTNRAGVVTAASCWAQEQRDVGRLCARKIIFRNPITGCALMFRRSLLADVFPLPAQPAARPFYYHDAWVALAALRRGVVLSVAEPLVRYRQHGGNAVGAETSGGVSLGSVPSKCLRSLATRQRLERDWLARSGVNANLFTSGFDLGLKILWRTCVWSVIASRGYLRIGLQLALGKLLWDLGRRLEDHGA